MERKYGREFDKSDEEEFTEEVSAIKLLEEKFVDIDNVLRNAALSAALLHYVFNKSQEYSSLLYYYTIQKYLKINETKNSTRNYNHINMEIFTVFIHPKSILQIPFMKTELISKIEENLDSEDCIIFFNKAAQDLVKGVLTKYTEQFRKSIYMGLESFSFVNKIHQNLSRTAELKILDGLHRIMNDTFIRNQKSRCLPSPKQNVNNIQLLYDFQIQALEKAMNTQYEYFLFSKKYSYTTKNPENLIPIKTFLSSAPVKLPSKQRIKGHCFDECSLPTVTFCLVCEVIIWGSYPNCLYCRNCKKAIHKDCKDIVSYCQIDKKMEKKYGFLETDIEKDKTSEGENVLVQITKNLTKINNANKSFEVKSQNETDMCKPPSNESISSSENVASPKLKEKINLIRKPSKSRLQDWKNQYSSFSNDKNEKSIKYTKSMNINTDIKKKNIDIVTRSKSTRSPSPENTFYNEYNRFNRRSTSESSKSMGAVLPLPISQLDTDDEMKIPETFEPESELQIFEKSSPNTNINTEGDFKRVLVLLEFHHKTKFTRMFLKRFKYLLVDPWLRMGEHLELFESLSLNCIDKLYTLIGSLVNVIDSCVGKYSYYNTVADKIFQWLSDDSDRNLRCWLELSMDLCCTNILQPVKCSWIEHKQMSPKLNELFSIDINRLPIIEQLSSMRPLLFNLPMIVTKIVKDLKAFSSFKDEAHIWEQIGQKLSRLPQLIDERCMPVVHLINNGIILNSNLKYKRYKKREDYNKKMEVFINNFPKTIFKNNFFDFQFVKVSNLRESYCGEAKSMLFSVYVKDEIDAAVICYGKEIILLQKESDKYLLKQFKSLGTQKLFPIIPLEHVHITKKLIKDKKEFQHELTVLVINQAILVQILFGEEKTRDLWFDHITKITIRTAKQIQNNNHMYIVPPNTNFDVIDGTEFLDFGNPNSKTSLISTELNDSVKPFSDSLDCIEKTLTMAELNLKVSSESESSDESTLDNETLESNKEKSQNIQNYIETIIFEALNKINYKSQAEEDKN